MTKKEELIRKWAKHVDEVKHPSHKQSGEPLYELAQENPIKPIAMLWIRCKAPGCEWNA